MSESFHNEDFQDLTFTDREILTTATHPDFRAWLARIRHIGGCQHPVHLVGHTLTLDTATGRLVHAFTSAEQPHGRLTIACGNRRQSRCEPCARLHQGDTYQVVVSGLAGGKSVPDAVRSHPRVFATFTAPSFGRVHRHATDSMCRPARRGGGLVCTHGRPVVCPDRHAADDPLIGSPLCRDCYDYPAAVLWNAHTRDLWQRLHRNLYESLASSRGISRTAARHSIRVAYAKVAEYQRRGSIHFHAVMRFDGPDGPGDPPPTWATIGLLTDTIRTATRRVHLAVAGTETILRFGAQLDIRPILPGHGNDDLTERAVASYIAKYVTKPDVAGITVDRPIRDAITISVLPVTDHARILIRTCWTLGGRPEHKALNLRRWAHQLGYRGHIASKSRAYSTTYTALRAAREEHRRDQADELLPDDPDAMTDKRWTYTGNGYTAGQAMFADAIADDLQTAREAARDADPGGKRDGP
ncbi:replication initiator [Micromonospora tarensis]|uniref:Replication initiation protein n=1 Tax=Micromonospora tarensis TaxID=2806100 RepID=A0ABS1YG55_9ACTN|nr:replication initiator [Micromonospora tarensis]MBM0276398.1 replication initiation protein [Micromonospora tarensis]